MDSIMDPELAPEMLKLLAQELKIVRTQLRETESKNDVLKADNAVLQQVIGRLQGELIQASSIKSEEILTNPLQDDESLSEFREEVARLNEDLTREKDEAFRNQESLSTLQKKYKRAKDKVHEYNEVLNQLRDALSNCTQELEQSRKAVVPEIDFKHFLKDFPYEAVEGQTELSSIQFFKLHKGIFDVCNGPYVVSNNEVIWSPSGIALGLIVKPMFQYNPRMRGGTWNRLEVSFDVGKQLDVCLLHKDGKSCYLGTYERVGEKEIMVIATESLKHMSNAKFDHVLKCTILFPDLVAPVQLQMIRDMYKRGVIKMQCFAIRCVAFNQNFAKKFEVNLLDATITSAPATSNGEARKRTRESKSTRYYRPNKKKRPATSTS